MINCPPASILLPHPYLFATCTPPNVFSTRSQIKYLITHEEKQQKTTSRADAQHWSIIFIYIPPSGTEAGKTFSAGIQKVENKKKKFLRKTPRQRHAIACLWETKLWWNWSRLKKIATAICYGLRDGTRGGARSKHYSGSRDKHRNWDVEKNDHDLQLDNIILMGDVEKGGGILLLFQLMERLR